MIVILYRMTWRLRRCLTYEN